MGVAWDSGHGLLPTKTSRFAFPLVEGSLSRINGGEIGVHAGACAFDGWCGCIWLTLVVYGIVYVAKPASGYFLQVGSLARCTCVLLMGCPAIQASSFYFTSGCMEGTQIVVIPHSLKLCSSS